MKPAIPSRVTTAGLVSIFEAERRRRGGGCPRCGSRRVQRWGKFGERLRYRCTSCRRTFSTFTGTPLAHLKLIDRWAAFCRCMDGRHTLRRAAWLLGVDKSTTFRWRHRVLTALRQTDQVTVGGRVEIGQFPIARSEKGSRTLQRPPRTRASWAPGYDAPADRVVVLDAQNGELVLELSGRGLADERELEAYLPRRLCPFSLLVTRSIPHDVVQRVAVRFASRNVQPRYRVGAPLPRTVHIGRSVRSWLKPFRGVATRYLPNYLVWFRFALRHQESSRACRSRFMIGDFS